MPPEDLTLLRRIRGTFRMPARDRWHMLTYAALFGVLFPAGFLYLLLRDGVPLSSYNADRWCLLALAVVGSPTVGIFFWRHADQQWEFTGQDIIYTCHGRVIWTLPIQTITFATILTGSHATDWLELSASGSGKKRSILLVPDLREHMRTLAQTATGETSRQKTL